jgi:transposase
MAMRRRAEERQGELWVATQALPAGPGHVFYERLNRLLSEAGFDRFVEDLVEEYYAENGRPGVAPGVYFRMLFVGYFEGIDSQRGIAWRCADSLSLRSFLGLDLTEKSPDHSSLTRIRDRYPIEIADEVFAFVLGMARERKLISGTQVGVDATLLEANAAMKSIVRRDTDEDWKAYLRRLMAEDGLVEDDEPTDEELRRFDRSRKGKKVSNEDWKSPVDDDARIVKMKDGRTHQGYKAEHTVDLDSEFVLSATVQHGTEPDSQTLCDAVIDAQENLDRADCDTVVTEVAADKGYHSNAQLAGCDELGLRTYIPEPSSPHQRKWTDKCDEVVRAVANNRRRMKRPKGKQLQKLRSERVERSFAHICETGGARRTWLRGLAKINKRYRLTVAAHNLGLLMRRLFGTGKPRQSAALQPLQLLQASASTALAAIRTTLGCLTTRPSSTETHCQPRHHPACLAP